MGLQQRASDWQDRILKAIILFAVIGCITLVIAVNMVGKMMADLTNSINPPQATTTTTTDGNNR